MMMVSRLSLALWLAASAPSVASDADTSHGNEVSLLQIALDVDDKPSLANSFNSPLKFAPSFTVNLDDPPASRWKAVTEYYYKTGLLKALLTDTGPQLTPEYKKLWLAAIKKQVDDETVEEARGMIEHIKTLAYAEDPSYIELLKNWTTYDLLLDGYMYEQNYPTFCSGILATMTNGSVVHGRNMDYMKSLHWKGRIISWPELTVDVTFTRGGKPLYTSVTWPMQLGIHTAMRFGGWSFEQNTRRTGNDMQENLAAVQQGALGFGFFARRLMEQVPDFDTAMHKLWSTNFASPQYFVMSGAKPYEGGVLSIDRFGKHMSGSPPLMTLSPQTTWHLVQTNDDLNKLPNDPRRPLVEARLSHSTQSQVSPSWMFEQMRMAPMFNPLTAFTWVAMPATGFSRTVLPPGTIDPSTVL